MTPLNTAQQPDTARLCWITGAGKGLGAATARALAAEGWRVVVSARSSQDLEQLAASPGVHPGEIVPLPVDVTRKEAMLSAYQDIRQRFGVPQLVILNAGTHQPMTVETFSSQSVEKLWQVNVMGIAHGLEATLPDLRQQGGRIMLVASVAGYRGLPTAAAYAASKAGVIAMGESLRAELEGTPLTIQVVNPGFIDTPLTQQNTFPMPFLMPVEKAAQRMVKALAHQRFEVTFPRRFTWLMKVLRLMPYGLYFFLAKRAKPASTPEG